MLYQISVLSFWRRPWKLFVCISSVESVACFLFITISSTTKRTWFSGNLRFALFNGPDTYLLLVCGSFYLLWTLWVLLWVHEVCASVANWLVRYLFLFCLVCLLRCWHAAWIHSSLELQTWSNHKECSFLQFEAFHLESLLFFRIVHLLRVMFPWWIQQKLPKVWPPPISGVSDKNRRCRWLWMKSLFLLSILTRSHVESILKFWFSCISYDLFKADIGRFVFL